MINLNSDINNTLSNNLVNNLNSKALNVKIAQDDKLMQTARDFEAVFITKFMETIDSTVERNGLMGNSNGEKIFKSMMYQEIGKSIASTPETSFGFAKQIYEQMKNRV